MLINKYLNILAEQSRDFVFVACHYLVVPMSPQHNLKINKYSIILFYLFFGNKG